MKVFASILVWILTINVTVSQEVTSSESIPRIGIIADCQYADQPTRGVRHYRLSSQKLDQCVDSLNQLQLDHVFHLGDFIDQDYASFEQVLPIMDRLKAPHTQVLGNHDFSVEEQYKEAVPQTMGLESRYFSIMVKAWKFIILDGNDVSLYAWPERSDRHEQASLIYQQHYADRETWNGAVGKSQMSWLKKELAQAELDGDPVILLCHFPVLPEENHILWNAGELVDLVSSYSCVKAWFNGHNHAGGYAEHQGIHFVTFQGMVDTDQNSYATVALGPNKLIIKGFGREQDRELELRP